MPERDHQELLLRDDDFIVSKTDPKGKITYCNRVFMEFSGYQEDELLGQPHNIIRHPDMPRSVYRLMWNTLHEGKEFFGVVKNRTKHGQYYWTFANVTPSYDVDHKLMGYYSVRRCPKRSTVDTMASIYREMIDTEARHSSSRDAMDASYQVLIDKIQSTGKSYEEYVISLEK